MESAADAQQELQKVRSGGTAFLLIWRQNQEIFLTVEGIETSGFRGPRCSPSCTLAVRLGPQSSVRHLTVRAGLEGRVSAAYGHGHDARARGEAPVRLGRRRARRRAATGATPLRCRRLQEDACSTIAPRRCGSAAACLRVRVESGKSLLTFKGPVQPSPMKLREEIETVVGDGETMLRCLEQLGYGVVVPLSEVPRGVRARRRRASRSTRRPWACSSRSRAASRASLEVTRALGEAPGDFVLDSYRSLFMEHRRAHGLPDTDMLFDEA